MTPTFEHGRRTASTYRHRGHAIAYRVEGDGPVLVAIHGFPSASWDWAPIWAQLTSRFRVVAADMIGFGDSDKPRDYAYSLVDQATLHAGLLRSLGIDVAHVLAHDYGVSVAQELLARHEARGAAGADCVAIASICFLNGGLFPEQHRPRLVQRLLASAVGPVVARLATKRTLRDGLRKVFGPFTPPSDAFVDELWTLLRHADGQRVLHRLIGYMAERRVQRERWVTPLLTTRVPLRLIDGPADPVSGAHLAARYRALVPDADVVELTGIGHYPQVEAPEAVVRGLFEFHDRVARPAMSV
jgi:pimeloyl-ACP methyl ester carboxylesterase